jgi:subtilisin family serine protease
MDSPALLVKVRGDGSAFKAALGKGFGSAEASVEAILKVPATGGGGLGLGAPAQSTWLRVGRAGSAATPWDLAHGLALSGEPFAASGGAVEAVEPDLEQQWAFRRSDGVGDSNHVSPGAAAACRFDDQSSDGNKAVGPGVAWNFANEFSQLAGARAQVGDKLGKILIAHLDTGFDPAHSTLPVNLKRQMQRNFVDKGLPNDATDHTPEDAFLTNRGHGAGTLSLLAGNRLNAAGPPWDGFQDVVGAAALAGIIPVRIADGVVRFTTGTMVQGFNYACEQNAHVLSMSMGGQSSQALVDAVNVAYESGLVMVTAAGNNFAGIPTPKSIVFPARLKRVLAACGVMADGRAYADLAFRTMQGNYGPAEKMQTALSAYTPNVPWAQIGCPHALRADNAYYSPQKVALLFGYFPSGSSYGDATAPGSMVFSCLSSDIIAHEMSHALLDGLHRKFQEASNPDVPAFHEAFADIVALFQHFTVTELVNFEIGRAHGKLSGAALLGGLAKQFGEGVSRCGPLRNYVDPKMKDLKYADTQEVHDRGSILVFAVYEAFLNIVARRTDDLIRLATGGTGVLPQGSLHPDLVARLTEETCKIAKHVLHICIRALDYCPAVDITFGEYLRALITSDTDLVPNDTLGYRVAFLEAFRSRGILPRDVRTISQESLAWNTLAQPSPDWLAPLIKGIDIRWDQDIDRSEVFRLNNENRKKLHAALAKIFADKPAVYEQFGLMPDVPKFNRAGAVSRVPKKGDTTFEVHSVRPARRIGPDGTFRVDLVVSIHQRQALPIDGHDVKNGWFWFRGGATLILDPREGKEAIRYAIVKNSGSASRQERQRQTVTGSFMSPLQALYFGRTDSEPFAAMHASYRGLDNV